MKSGTVTVNGTRAPVDPNHKFSGYADVVPGTNQVKVIATEQSGRATTNTYQVIVNQTGSPVTLSYDLNGNMLSDGEGRAYQWDGLNRLVKITQGSNIWEFQYNGLSQRVIEKLNGTTIHKWLWCKDGNQPCQQRNADDSVARRYYQTGFTEGTGKYFYTKDHLGSIREVTDLNQTIQAKFEYDPYGRRTQTFGTLQSTFGFTGHWQHESGLILTKYRGYDANNGRWISRDPLTNAEFKQGADLYRYVSNNPIQFIDIEGLCECDYLECLNRCAAKNMGIVYAALTIMGLNAPIPKALLPVPNIGSPWTNLLSYLALGQGTAASGKNVVRVLAREGIGLAIGAAMIDGVFVGCLIGCGINSCAY